MSPQLISALFLVSDEEQQEQQAESSSINNIFAAAVTFLLTLGLSYLFYPAIVAATSSNDSAYRIETLIPPVTEQGKKHGEKEEEDEVLLSIIIPAYNEESRLPKMLSEAYSYLSQQSPQKSKGDLCAALQDLLTALQQQRQHDALSPSSISVEWIVVDDGSKDNTRDVYRQYVSKLKESPTTENTNKKSQLKMSWKLLPLATNSGKGAAVQAGMLVASGGYCLMVDADGATDFGPGLEALAARCFFHEKTTTNAKTNAANGVPADAPQTPQVVLGSREDADKNSDASAKRHFIRSILTQSFHLFVAWVVGAGDIRDTQCGFKLFTAAAAGKLFGNLHLRRWAFDTEIVFLAGLYQYNMQEVTVPWEEVAGSKLNTSPLNLALVAVSMLRDMICVRLCYTLGLWKVNSKSS